MRPIFVLGDRLKLGNALSSYGSFCLLADEINASVICSHFSVFQDLFSRREVEIFDSQGEINRSSLKGNTENVIRLLGKKNIIENIIDFEVIHKDKYFRYSKYDSSAIILSQVCPYYCPLELVEKDILQKYKYILVPKPYRMQYQFPRDSSILNKIFSLNEERRDGLIEGLIKSGPAHSSLIGIHVRQGDYEKWRKGRYLFSISEYIKIMCSIGEIRAEKSSFLFYVASNVDHTLAFENSHARGFNSLVLNANFIDDFLALSCSDLIVGPPSTFGHWAAFLGITKRYIMDSGGYQHHIFNEMVIDRLPIVKWPFSAGLKNDFWQEG